MPGEMRLTTAGPGDHPSIQYFLQTILHGPAPAEFQAQLEDPFYEPCNRLIIKRGDRIIAHLRLSHREMCFGHTHLPVTMVSDLATLPEFRGQGCATALLAEATRRMSEEGGVMGLLHTAQPQFPMQRGWAVCGRHCFSIARPRDILSYLSATHTMRKRRTPAAVDHLFESGAPAKTLNIRLWRHIERAALQRLYSENTRGSYGPILRTDPYWCWLISRRGYDRIYVAIEGPDKFELDDSLAPIVGYAAMREGRIVEMMTSEHHPDVRNRLLARACGDAIERDYHLIRFDGPPGDPLHQAMEMAGGKHCYHEAEQGEVFLGKLLDPASFLRSLCPRFHERAKAAELSRPCDLGLHVDDVKYQLIIGRRGVKVNVGKLGRSYVKCSQTQFMQLLLGHLRVHDVDESGRIEFSTRVAVDIASVLFPSLPFWHPPLDALPS